MKFIKLLNFISGGISLCLVTSLPLSLMTNTKNSETSVLGISDLGVPVLKDNISFTGNINILLNGDGRADVVNKNLNKIINYNKNSMLKNLDEISELDLNTLSFECEILNWNNWGNQTFDEWKNNGVSKEVTYSEKDKIIFQSKNQLKNFLENNLIKLLSDPNVKLADAEFGISNFGDLLIPLVSNSTNTSNDKIVLKIPSKSILFTPKIKITGSYGIKRERQITSKNISLECNISNFELIPITFTEKANNKKDIILDEKPNDANKVNLWEQINDKNIFEKLSWIKKDVLNNENINNSNINLSMFDLNVIYDDLGLNKDTDEILKIRIEFINGESSRRPSNSNYNGLYKILIDTIKKNNNNNSDLKIKTYEVVSSINQNKNTNPLQVNVPDAFLLDTNLGGGKYMYITKEFFGNQSFEMGFKTYSGSPAQFVLLHRNLSNGRIISSFIKKIHDSAKAKGIQISNGLIFIIDRVNVNTLMGKYSNNVRLRVLLRRGFKFKDTFTLELQDKNKTYKYNTKGNTGSVIFGIDISSKQNEAAIWGNYSKTINEIVLK
ncbi:hypothetical protein [Malacoplasma iowae]|uniref:hypothetical protein n=1 Tax=Malacoplasma iowae TaxID=2116 RepID=UPI003872BF08|nr:hypothetical protein QX181_04305 [Malacoplasma iowae]